LTIDDICRKYSAETGPKSIEDAMKVLNIEKNLRTQPEYLEETSKYIQLKQAPPIRMDSDVQKKALELAGFSNEKNS